MFEDDVSFDSLLSESYQYGVIRPSDESEYCDEVFNENFKQAIKLIERDDSGFLGLELDGF
ncbi:hypothetical protein [Vibrio sp. E150_018]